MTLLYSDINYLSKSWLHLIVADELCYIDASRTEEITELYQRWFSFYYLLPLDRLWVLHNIWQLDNSVAPP